MAMPQPTRPQPLIQHKGHIETIMDKYGLTSEEAMELNQYFEDIGLRLELKGD